MEKPKGCDLCGDFPAQLRSRCHPSAPLRVEMPEEGWLTLYCYVPTCNREVARFRLGSGADTRNCVASSERPMSATDVGVVFKPLPENEAQLLRDYGPESAYPDDESSENES